MHSKEFRCLTRRGFPWGKQDGNDQDSDHAIEDSEVHLLRRRGAGLRASEVWRRAGQSLPAVRAEPINLGQRSMAGRAGLHEAARGLSKGETIAKLPMSLLEGCGGQALSRPHAIEETVSKMVAEASSAN
jgi:hypothetical protein